VDAETKRPQAAMAGPWFRPRPGPSRTVAAASGSRVASRPCLGSRAFATQQPTSGSLGGTLIGCRKSLQRIARAPTPVAARDRQSWQDGSRVFVRSLTDSTPDRRVDGRTARASTGRYRSARSRSPISMTAPRRRDIGTDQITPFLGVEFRGGACRVHKIAEHHRDMAALAGSLCASRRSARST
jgi:hypothetical protein